MEITIGLDLAKKFFQVHGVDAAGCVIVRKVLRRRQVLPFFEKLSPCLIGMEACGTSHHWARELMRLGHEVRLMPPAYVKPYVKRGKTDANDAEAICEAVTRPTMRFVSVKSPEQQSALSVHRARNLLVKQRTQLINMIRGLLAEFGVDIPRGLHQALALARSIAERSPLNIPTEASSVIEMLQRICSTATTKFVTSIAQFCIGIAAMRSHEDWLRSQASGLSPPRRLRPPSPTRINSNPGANSPPGWV